VTVGNEVPPARLRSKSVRVNHSRGGPVRGAAPVPDLQLAAAAQVEREVSDIHLGNRICQPGGIVNHDQVREPQ
jgi:hypothetical protein